MKRRGLPITKDVTKYNLGRKVCHGVTGHGIAETRSTLVSSVHNIFSFLQSDYIEENVVLGEATLLLKDG